MLSALPLTIPVLNFLFNVISVTLIMYDDTHPQEENCIFISVGDIGKFGHI